MTSVVKLLTGGGSGGGNGNRVQLMRLAAFGSI
jgi:hypothetical protein